MQELCRHHFDAGVSTTFQNTFHLKVRRFFIARAIALSFVGKPTPDD